MAAPTVSHRGWIESVGDGFPVPKRLPLEGKGDRRTAVDEVLPEAKRMCTL